MVEFPLIAPNDPILPPPFDTVTLMAFALRLVDPVLLLAFIVNQALAPGVRPVTVYPAIFPTVACTTN